MFEHKTIFFSLIRISFQNFKKLLTLRKHKLLMALQTHWKEKEKRAIKIP